MNRLLYGLPDLKGMAQDMKEIREQCPECDGYGRILFFSDTGERVSEEDFKVKTYEQDITMERCARCEGTGFLNSYIEEPNPIY